MATGSAVRIRLLDTPSDFTREQHDEMSRMLQAAVAEAGHPTTSKWDESIGCYYNDPPVPEDVLYKARKLVCDRLGLPYEIVED